MKTKSTSLKTIFAAGVVTCTLLGPLTATAAPGTLSDSPLFLSNAVEPNILFRIDDSGSMDWSLMTPEGGFGGTMTINGCEFYNSMPAPDNIATFYAVMPTEAQMVVFGWAPPYLGVWRAWNKDYNAVYYNPEVTYSPWPGEDSANNLYTDMDPTAALYDPYLPASGSLDLTTVGSYVSDCNGGTPFTVNNFYPARYQTWTDTNTDGIVDAADVHTLVEIRSTTPMYTGGIDRTDCGAAPACTYAEEIQNFANWYSYDRRREFVAKAAYGEVVAGASNARMGMGTLHNNGGVNTAIASMNQSPTTGAKGTLLDSLYSMQSGGGTPLRIALDDSGDYLACDTNNISGTCPALSAAAGGECQQNFTLLMTDGFANGGAVTVGNADGDDDSMWDSGVTGPYGDGNSNTLADVAMKFYEDDLRPTVANNLNPPPGGIDENTAQHMVTYSVAFGVDGTLTTSPPNTTDPFAWPVPLANDPTGIDDLRHAAFNGHGEFLSAQDPGQLISGLRGALTSIQGRIGSAASVAFNTGSLSTNSEVYLALFNSERWNGNLLAFPLDPNTGAISAIPSWSAATQLDARNVSTTPRTLLTYDGADGTAFQWASLTAAQKGDFRTNPSGAVDDEATGMARHAFMRGHRACEFSSMGTCTFTDGTNTFNTKSLRERSSRLGDIIHSGPVFAGAPESNWPDTAPFPSTTTTAYSAFRLANASRPGVIYVGGNDGILHGFAQATGEEVMGYVPGSLYSTDPLGGLHYLSDPAYAHRYGVDLTPSIADAYVKTETAGSAAWKTILVGGLRAGGRGLFALDVTDPTAFNETASAAAKAVMWEFDSSDDADLGHTFSRPSIVPLEGPSGTIRWAAIVGNGYNDLGSGEAKLFILFLEDGLDGTWTAGTDYIEISTDSGDTSDRNGLATPAVIDSDGNGLADRVYAGDLNGDMWVFDLDGSNTSNWDVAYKSGPTPRPLFEAPANQQITTTPVIVRNKNVPTSGSNTPNTLVIFGTGQYITAGDTTTTDTQAMYGVWDHGDNRIDQGDLVEQTIGTGTTTGGVLGRTLTNNAISYGSDDGWYIELPDSGERLITDPVIRGDLVFFNTMKPDTNPCNFGGSGYLMVAKWINGGHPDEVAFDINNDSALDALDEINGDAAAGTAITGIATSPVNLANKRYTSTTETTGGSSIGVTDIAPTDSNKTGRLSWEELTQ